MKTTHLTVCILHIMFVTCSYGQYCEPTSTNGPSAGTYVDDVILGDISNTSTGSTAGPNYNDYTAFTTTLELEVEQTLTIGTGTYSTNTYYFVWIDYNQDNDFEDGNELIGSFLAPGVNTTQIVVFTPPVSAKTGSTRMRVTCAYNTPGLLPCDSYDYGETEDYTLEFAPFEKEWFSEVSAGLTAAYNAKASWIDINNDNYPDISIFGQESLANTTPQGKIFVNDQSGGFSFAKNIRALQEGDISWCDFNNDGNPDLLYAGEASGLVAGIDLYDQTGINYTPMAVSFTPVKKSSVDWGDYDNDGDYDVVICGIDINDDYITTLYTNQNGSFTKTKTDLPGIANGKISFIDYDLDSDLDIFLSGQDNSGNNYSKLWANTNGIFNPANDYFVPLSYNSFDWGDFNGDKYPDLLLCGDNRLEAQSEIYINDEGNSFTALSSEITGYRQGDCKFGDIDADGNSDVLLLGVIEDITATTDYIFLNSNSDSITSSGFQSTGLFAGSVQTADYDLDNDLDFLLNGRPLMGSTTGVTSLFNNDSTFNNSAPKKPANVVATVEGRDVLINWNRSSDDHTPSPAITYNLYLGTSSKGVDIVSPMADISTGLREIYKAGFIKDTFWIVKNLDPGTYYLGVQSIDNSFISSKFSTEISFEIKDRITEFPYSDGALTTIPTSYFDSDHDGDYDIFLSGFTGIDNRFAIAKNELPGTLFSPSSYQHITNIGGENIFTFSPNDYNNNNEIDFSVSANYYGTVTYDSILCLFNYDTPFNYSLSDSTPVSHIDFEYVHWIDLNNDGLQDIITSGMTTNLGVDNAPITKIIQNLGAGQFQEINHSIRGFSDCNATYSDFDMDMDIDIVIYGKDINGSPNTYLYLNQGDFTFSEVLIPGNKIFRKQSENTILTGDYNLDGNPDLFVAGSDSFGNMYTKVLINENLIFEDANLPISSWPYMSNFWSDYDLDGDLDIFVLPSQGSDDILHIYLNNNGSLELLTVPLNSVTNLSLPFQAPNLNNKEGLDFILSNGSGSYSQYYDNWGSNNRITSPPENLYSELDGFDIILNWDKDLDCPGCTYNLRIGTNPDSCDILSPMADIQTGFRYVLQPGNAFHNDSWRIEDLKTGKYYWTVQTIDLAGNGRPWAALDSFELRRVSTYFMHDTVCHGNSTIFTDMSEAMGDETIDRWQWDFGDGKGSIIQNPTHIFEQPGNYLVSLTAYIGEIFHTYSDTVNVKHAPDAIFSVMPVCKDEISTLINQSNIDNIDVASWIWDFGNGETSTYQGTIEKAYIKSDTATLTIVASNGCSDIESKAVIVAEYPDIDIELVEGYSNNLCYGDTTILTVSNNNNYKFQWKFNNVNMSGMTDTFLVITKNSGLYSIEAVHSIVECSTTKQTNIEIIDVPPTPQITPVSDDLCPLEQVELSISNYDERYNYQWLRNGILIEGAIYDTLNRILTEADYSIISWDNKDCPAISQPVTIIFKSDIEKPDITVFGPVVWYLGCANDSALNYRWYYNNELITNETDFICMANQNLGSYFVEISDGSGCVAYSDVIEIPNENYKLSTKPDSKGSIKVYPIGQNNLIQIEILNEYVGEVLVHFINTNGQVILKSNIYKVDNKLVKRFNTKQLPKGVNYIRVFTNEFSETKSIIIN